MISQLPSAVLGSHPSRCLFLLTKLTGHCDIATEAGGSDPKRGELASVSGSWDPDIVSGSLWECLH